MHIHQRLFRLSGALLALMSLSANAAELATAKVRETSGASVYVAEGVAESVQQSVIAAQVAGRIEQLSVKAGDRVQKRAAVGAHRQPGGRATDQRKNQARVASAKAQLDVARKELERQQHTS